MTSGWHHWMDEGELARLLPPAQAHFARPIVEALLHFIAGLSPVLQAEILAAQAGLPAGCGLSARLAGLARCCPVLHKLGQVMARDRRLAPHLRQELQQLESLPATVPMADIRRALTAELGDLAGLGLKLQPPALAQASVAVVIPFQRRTDTAADRDPPPGVFKLLKPGIRERLELELDLLSQVGAYLDERCDKLRLPHLDYQQAFEQVRGKLRHEVQLEVEQRHLAQAAAFYRCCRAVHIPELMEFCSPSVTSMERIFGRPITALPPEGLRASQDRVRVVADALLAQPLLAAPGMTLFHGDPHAGNLFWTDEDRLAILDWSLVGQLSADQRQILARLLLAAVTGRRDLMIDLLSQLTTHAERTANAGAPRLGEVVDRWLKRRRGGPGLGLGWLTGMLDDAVQTAGLRFDADLMLFRKTWHTLEGVLADLQATPCQVDRVLSLAFVRQLATEWPFRWMAGPFSRDFATQLSNADLAIAALALPWSAAEYWWQQGLDLWRFLEQLTGPPRAALRPPARQPCESG